MINPFLIAKHIYLRPLMIEDADGDYIEWLNDPDVCRYNSHHLFPYNKQKAQQYIQDTLFSNNSIVLALCLKSSDRHIGNISLQNINLINRSAEFAIIIGDKASWGKGYSKEAAAVLIKHGFNELNLHRIYCGTSAENIPMQKLAIFLGMKEEGRRKEAIYKSGLYLDVIEYGLLEKNFIGK